RRVPQGAWNRRAQFASGHPRARGTSPQARSRRRAGILVVSRALRPLRPGAPGGDRQGLLGRRDQRLDRRGRPGRTGRAPCKAAVRVVSDTVVILRAYINAKSRWGRLLARHAAGYHLVVSPPIVAESLDVLLRPELTRRFPALTSLPTTSLFGLLAQA